MKELSFDEMMDTTGGDLCGPGNNAGIVALRFGPFAVFFTCGGEYIGLEYW